VTRARILIPGVCVWTSRIDAGMVFVNHRTTPDLLFGGIKDSGYGRELSSMGIQKLVDKKLVRVASIDAPA
jgi:succinate-semialdehyde dehydrogenase / glutarate-semialdehyde dehydrogenase